MGAEPAPRRGHTTNIVDEAGADPRAQAFLWISFVEELVGFAERVVRDSVPRAEILEISLPKTQGYGDFRELLAHF